VPLHHLYAKRVEMILYKHMYVHCFNFIIFYLSPLFDDKMDIQLMLDIYCNLSMTAIGLADVCICHSFADLSLASFNI